MAYVQQIKAAVGECDLLAIRTPFFCPALELFAVEDFFVAQLHL